MRGVLYQKARVKTIIDNFIGESIKAVTRTWFKGSKKSLKVLRKVQRFLEKFKGHKNPSF